MGKATGFLEYDRHEDSWVSEEKRITGFEEFHNHLSEEERHRPLYFTETVDNYALDRVQYILDDESTRIIYNYNL